mmetsp:Transcript_14140/g.40072  ORF Transcript_14140/g.40072 Transcript_14140/m.40072 type:complete len:206 (+) Transcript_14140:862-1479(+)
MVPTVKFVSTTDDPSSGSKAMLKPSPPRSRGSSTFSEYANRHTVEYRRVCNSSLSASSSTGSCSDPKVFIQVSPLQEAVLTLYAIVRNASDSPMMTCRSFRSSVASRRNSSSESPIWALEIAPLRRTSERCHCPVARRCGAGGNLDILLAAQSPWIGDFARGIVPPVPEAATCSAAAGAPMWSMLGRRKYISLSWASGPLKATTA